ncbi:DUF4179 domain-containing protein [Paenibacillus glacialis]|uniref:DUF4179 domain-containing protein n=1 Tax=Paenibacillus glacialis TaxID=494026 RepID=A0A168M7Q6_9BACL|nr:DUF4179 domain-containing protein [Paenibacillus glacialis]OAB44335.1 hypothetical protein PGLA_06645 [Paenibacillus glacialis]
MSNPTEQETDCELDHRIETAITDGIRKGQTEITRRRKQRRRRLTGSIVTTFLFLTCLFTIRVSPVFAAMVRDIPGLEKFVDLINDTSDKGIKLALDNDFIQPVGVFEEREGMKFMVQGIIADDSRIVVFYDIQLSDKDNSALIDKISLLDDSGKEFPAVIRFNSPEEAKQDIRETGFQRGTADFQLEEGTSLPSEVILKVLLKKSALPNLSNVILDKSEGEEGTPVIEGDISGTEFNVKIPIDRARFAGLQEEYIIGETIKIEGQSITFAKAVVSPLSISLYIDYDNDNSKQVFGPGDIVLVDDEGTVWNNTIGVMVKDHPVYHFESPYFREPKSLTIKGSWFRALDKNKLSVIVDTEKGQLLQAPDGKLNYRGLTNVDKNMKLDFSLNGLDPADKMMYSLLFEEEFTDAAGIGYKKTYLEGSTTTGYFRGSSTVEQHSLQYI